MSRKGAEQATTHNARNSIHYLPLIRATTLTATLWTFHLLAYAQKFAYAQRKEKKKEDIIITAITSCKRNNNAKASNKVPASQPASHICWLLMYFQVLLHGIAKVQKQKCVCKLERP